LTLQRGDRGSAICKLGLLDFACVLDANGWSNVEWLLEPFCNSNATGFQWLIKPGGIALLISRDGHC